ncbi:MAG: hypothetical protein GQ557_00495 [Mycoplasmataceae bacterium]|nr:hypothetical protein [Mycoplasmataceae bacterium]
MKKQKIIGILEEQFPSVSATTKDFIGQQISGEDEIDSIIIALDLTTDVIYQAIEMKAQLIIVHHPLFYGEKKLLLKENPHLQAKKTLLEKMKINVFVIHTNADFNPNSISFNQALALGFEEITNLSDNLGVKAKIAKKTTIHKFVKELKNKLELDYDFRTNIDNDLSFDKFVIGSGTSGDLLELKHFHDYVFVIGEMKHHQWVKANEEGTKVIEIGHFSESIFKVMIKIILESEQELNIILAKEKNGYKTI